MKIALLLTGNELMSGDTVDTNSNYLAQSLKDLCLVPSEKRVVGDDLSLLTRSIKEMTAHADVLVINGGLGPTVDDLTAVALAQAASLPIERHPDALSRLEDWARARDFVLTESNLKQADLPQGCEIIDNPRGSAVGFSLELNDCLVLCTPGVPSEFKTMVEEQLLPRVRQRGDIQETSTITRLRLFGITESGLQDMINADFPDWPEDVEIGFRVQMPVIEIKVVTVGHELDAKNQQWTKHFVERFSDYVIGRDSTRLTQALNQALQEVGKTVAVAESCTGGAIAAGITSEPGSSSIFEAGWITYSNEMKRSLLGVPAETLEQYGAVSSETVEAMAFGAIDKSGSDLAVAVSGVAGPTGGTPEKPVGTVWMAFGSAENLITRKFFLPLARTAFQRTATAIAMDLVRRFTLGLPTDVDYFSELKRKQNSSS